MKKKLKKLRCKELKERVHETEEDSRGRSNLQRDYARVLYSTAFRRLQGKMQLFGIDYAELKGFIEESDLNMKPGQQTFDCAVMDLADEIAYAAHDLEDALQLKYINADELLYLFEREADDLKYLKKYCKNGNKSEIKRAHKKLKKLIETARERAKTADGPSDDIFDSIFRKELSAEIVNTLIKDIKYIAGKKNTLVFDNHNVLCKGLKTLLFNAIKNDSRMILYYEKQGKIVLEGLYEVFSDKKFNKDNCLLPSAYQQYETEPQRKRMIIDYIAGMQESFAIEQYEKYFGADSLDKVYRKRE